MSPIEKEYALAQLPNHALFHLHEMRAWETDRIAVFMHDAKTIASAPRSTIILARVTARFPGQPPQER
jgi:hypothetical protein